MFAVANLISASATVLHIVLTAIAWIIIIRAVLSWVNPDPHNPLVQSIYGFAEFFLAPIRNRLPFSLRFGAVDVSPFIAILAVILLDRFLVVTLFELSMRLKAG